MGIRTNDDVDIIISSNARYQLFNNTRDFIRQGTTEIFDANKSKFKLFGAAGDDDLINNFSFQIDGYNFLEPRFYFSRKRQDREKDKLDWEGICKFFKLGMHEGYPYNKLTLEQWGYKYVVDYMSSK